MINGNKVFVTIVLLVILIYVLYAVYLIIKQPTDTFTVEQGTLYLEESVVGYVIRDETVIKGENYKNGMEQIISEGEKVAKNEAAFRYYSNNEEDLKKKIEELDEQIQEAMANEDTSIYSSDIKLLEEQIDEKVKDLSQLTDISTIQEYQKSINDLITKKAKIAGDLSPSGSHIKQLIEERSTYESQLNSGSEYVVAPSSGVVSYRVDGLEDTLTTTDFSTLSKEYLESLDLKTGKIVATSEECGKVIDNFSCYIAVLSSSDKAKEAEVGDKVSVRLSNSDELSSSIVYVNQEDDGEVLLVVEVNQLTDELINYRKMQLSLVWWSDKGLKVPNQAIKEVDGLQYVVRSRAGYLNKVLVKVLRQNEKYSIVSSYTTDELKELGFSSDEISSYKKISMYDEILINPKIENVE
jgi:putative membrane fusion protein